MIRLFSRPVHMLHMTLLGAGLLGTPLLITEGVAEAQSSSGQSTKSSDTKSSGSKSSKSKAKPKTPPPPPEPTPPPVSPEEQLARQMIKLNLEFDTRVEQCREQYNQGLYAQCLKALDELEKMIPAGEQSELLTLRTRLDARKKLTQDLQQVGALDPEQPDLYYRSVLRSYASLPQEHFPHDEVMAVWNIYLRSEQAQARFDKYRSVRAYARPANKNDTHDVAAEQLFYQHVQQRFVDYGFRMVDLESTTANGNSGQTEVLLKLTLDGSELPPVLDPTMGLPPGIAKPIPGITPTNVELRRYRLLGQITTLKFTGANGVSLPPRDIEVIQADMEFDTARDKAIALFAPQVADAIFYLTLRQLFMQSSG